MRCLILLAGLVLWTGCKGGIDKTLNQIVEERHHLEPSGNLHVKNEDGAIRLYGSDAPGLHVKAIKRAYSTERLQAIGVRITSQADSTSIETVSPPRKKWSLRDRSGTVDYIIIMPETLASIQVELVNGEISIDGLRGGTARTRVVNGRSSARNCFANLDYHAENGAIDFYYNWWEAGDYLVKATIPNGAIGVLLPRSASFHLEAETNGGSIMGNLVEGDEGPHGHRKKLTTNVGSGKGAVFRLKAVNGNIRVHGY